MEVLKTRQDVSEQRIRALEENFEASLSALAVPRFSEQPRSALDRKTYLPIIDGRRLDDLSSQWLQTLVNVAYAIAHQKTAIELGLRVVLPEAMGPVMMFSPGVHSTSLFVPIS